MTYGWAILIIVIVAVFPGDIAVFVRLYAFVKAVVPVFKVLLS